MSVEDGLVAAVRGTGIRTTSPWPDTVNPDIAIVEGPVTLDDAVIDGSLGSMLYDVTFLFDLARGRDRAHRELIPYLMPSGRQSVKAAIEEDPTLGGEVECLLWRGIINPPGRMEVPDKRNPDYTGSWYYGATVRVEVFAS